MTEPVKSRATPWDSIILTCGKCARKLKGGYGPKHKDSLRTALRSGLKAAGHGRDVRIIETRCMGLCPKNAVVALNAGLPETILEIPQKTPIAEALARLGVA